uniref:WD repeat domain phosphoinositide-interacting protein n=1 Tax=Brachionus calyciflorus TaxID=104777 RepID=A0A2Z4EUN8_9BILA|nr:WD repeat domain phosphoinositide-interacting protein [Brachionus calyciflorus]
MNLVNAGSLSNDHNDILFVNFNQDCTSLAVGTKTGYRLYTVNSSEKLQETYSCEKDIEDICIVERLFSSSLIAIVSMANPRKLRVYHFKKGTEICNYCYSNTVLSVRLNRNRLVVCLDERIDIHNISDMRVIHTIRDIPSNPKGLCALSVDNEKSYLAYPGSSQVGEVQIFDTMNLRPITMIPAHDSPLAAIAFDWHGSKLATASEKGTVIRVFSVPQGKRLFEFRRGIKRNAAIYSLSFSPDSLFLSASSNLETIHIFRLDAPKEKPQEENQSWMSYFNKAVQSAANYLPTQASDVLTQDRAFATVNVPNSALNYRNICALTYIQKNLRLLMASADGYFYMFDVNTQEGGVCKLLTQSSIYVPNSSLFNNSLGKDVVNNSNFNSNPINIIDNNNLLANNSCAKCGVDINNNSGGSYAQAACKNVKIEPDDNERIIKNELASQAGVAKNLIKLSDTTEFPPMITTKSN